MKKIIALILGMLFLFGSISWAEPPELSKQQKLLLRPYLHSVEGECYSVPMGSDFDVDKNEIIEITYSYPYWACGINEVTCVSTNSNIVKQYKDWNGVYIDNGLIGGPSITSYFFKVIAKGECDIILTIDGKPYIYHFNCG